MPVKTAATPKEKRQAKKIAALEDQLRYVNAARFAFEKEAYDLSERAHADMRMWRETAEQYAAKRALDNLQANCAALGAWFERDYLNERYLDASANACKVTAHWYHERAHAVALAAACTKWRLAAFFCAFGFLMIAIAGVIK